MRDPEHGVEGAERVLKDHRHLPPIPEQVLSGAQAVNRTPSVVDLPSRGLVDQTEQPGDGALAAAALPHQGDDLALPDRHVEVVHGVEHPLREHATEAEMPGQLDSPQERLLAGGRAGPRAQRFSHG